MSSISIRSVINENFVKRFQSLAGSTKSASQAFRSGSSSSSDLSNAMRTGARSFSNALNNLNAAAGFIHLSKETLVELGEIVDDLIVLAEKASRASSSGTFSTLDSQFKKLTKRYWKLVDNAEELDQEYLTVPGLKEIFTTIGLDSSKADDLAKLFDEFVVAKSDGDKYLASDEMKAVTRKPLPASAFSQTITTAYSTSAEQLSANDLTNIGQTGFISTSTSTFQSNNSGTGVNTLYFEPDGTDFSDTTSFSLKAINQDSGYSIVSSTADLLTGQNSSNYNQLFLIDTDGNAVHQITNNAAADIEFGEVDLSADNLQVVYAYSDGSSTYMARSTYAALGGNPATNSYTTMETYGGGADLARFDNVTISNDGSYLAYRSNATGTWATHLKDSTGLTSDATLSSDDTILRLGFIDSNKLAVVREVDTTHTISTYSNGAGLYSDIAEGLSVDKFATLEKGTQNNGFISYSSSDAADQNDVYVINDNGTAIVDYDADGASDSIEQISMAFNAANAPDVGIFGVLTGVNSDSDNEMYRLTTTGGAREIRFSTQVSRPNQLLGGSFNLKSRAAGFVALDDLKAIRKQIEDNLENLDEVFDYLQKNIDLVRATGLAMLNLSEQIKDSDTAAKLADRLRSEIINNTSGRIDQIHNLNSIAAAALLQ